MKKQLLGIVILVFIGACLFWALNCRNVPPGKPLGSTYHLFDEPEVWKVPALTRAQLAGLKPGDVVISYNEEPTPDLKSLHQAEANLTDKTGTVKLVVMRDNQEITLEANPGPLEFIPLGMRYSASLAKALEDIMAHYGQTGYYDWLAGLTGESFSLNVFDEDCASWGYNGRAEDYLEGLERHTGLSIKRVWQAAETTDTATGRNAAFAPLRNILEQGGAALVRGGWSKNPYLWGIATRLNTADSTVYGYSVGMGREQPLDVKMVSAVYEVKCRKKVTPDPEEMLATALDQALELGLASTESGWHSGLEAYDIVIKKLGEFPMSPSGTGAATEDFYRLVWSLISSKESVNRLFEDIKNALPEKAALIDEVMARNRAIIGKLEGLAATRIPLNTLQNQQKLARVLLEIQNIENDLLGLYEEIIGAS